MFIDWQELVETMKEEEIDKNRSRLVLAMNGSYDLNGVKELTSLDWEKVKKKMKDDIELNSGRLEF